MYLVYVDDSKNADYCVIGAAIIAETDFNSIEDWLGATVLTWVPEDQRGTFEFHASELISGRPPFDKIDLDTRLKLVRNVASVMEGDKGHHFIYGAVDLRALHRSRYAFAQPETIAFDICLDGIHQWFKQQQPADEMGLLISDEMAKETRGRLQQRYRERRGKTDPTKYDHNTLAEYIHDDMYFGQSSYSVGLQVADICSNLVLRHLRGDDLTASMYNQISAHVFFGKVDVPA